MLLLRALQLPHTVVAAPGGLPWLSAVTSGNDMSCDKSMLPVQRSVREELVRELMLVLHLVWSDALPVISHNAQGAFVFHSTCYHSFWFEQCVRRLHRAFCRIIVGMSFRLWWIRMTPPVIGERGI